MTPASAIGKRVRGARYIHVSAIAALTVDELQQIHQAREIARDFSWNVARFERGYVGLLDYPAFDDEAFPALARAARIDLDANDAKITDFRRSSNPLILHRKELLVSDDYPGRGEWAALTNRLEQLGLFRESHRIGRRNAWNALLAEARLDERGRRLP